MVAVIDREIGRAVKIGPAAPADLLRRFVHANSTTGVGQPHARGKTGNSGADNMNRLLHQMNAYWMRMAIFAVLFRRMGCRGG